MQRYCSTWTSRWPENANCKECIYSGSTSHTHIRNLAYTWLLCMRCGPSYEINMVRVAWLHPPPKMYFHVNAMGASSHWYSRATRPSHFFSWDRTEANSSPKHYRHFIFAHNKPWLGKRVPHQETPKGWPPRFTSLFFGKISMLMLAQQAQIGKRPFWAPHSWVPAPLHLHLSAQPCVRWTGAVIAARAPSWRQLAPTCRAQPGTGESGAMPAHFSTLFHVQLKTKLSVINKTWEIWETRFAKMLF